MRLDEGKIEYYVIFIWKCENFQVKWKNYPPEDNTWESEENTTECGDEILKFKNSDLGKQVRLPWCDGS